MRKKILLVIVMFFLFNSRVSAATIQNMLVNINVDAKGEATVVETWTVGAQNVNYLEKAFSGVDITVSDIRIVDKNNTEFSKKDKFDIAKSNIYTYEDNGGKKRLKFTVDGKENIYQISYKVHGMIHKYTDIEGLDWVVFARVNGLSVDNLDAYIKFATPVNETNCALYAHGTNVNATLIDGLIHVKATSLSVMAQVRLLTTFNDLKFVNALVYDTTFNEHYDSVVNSNEILEEIKYILEQQLVQYILLGLLGIITLTVVVKFLTRFKKVDEYTGIVTENNKTIMKLDQVGYCDSVPCNGDLYKIAFLAGYFKITKNRSNIIGAIILKWMFDGAAKVGIDKNRPFIKIMPSQYYDRKMDMDLYEILSAASNYGIIDGSKLSRYANDHYLRVVTWFNMGFHEVISDEFSRGNIKKIKKFGRVKLVINDKLIDEANQIQGLKRYLLNFNQVPRQTPLTEQGYKYLLICAELLGIGHEVAKEILRKNPDNFMAKQLLELSAVRYAYKNFYQTALIPYKQVVKSKVKMGYDPEFDNLVSKKNQLDNQRTSRL